MKLNVNHVTMIFSKTLHFEVCFPLVRFYCSEFLVTYTVTLAYLYPPTALKHQEPSLHVQYLQIIEWGKARNLLIKVKQGTASQKNAQQSTKVVVDFWFQEQVTAFKRSTVVILHKWKMCGSHRQVLSAMLIKAWCNSFSS